MAKQKNTLHPEADEWNMFCGRLDTRGPEDTLSFNSSLPCDSRVSCLSQTLEVVLVLGLPAGLLGVHSSGRLCTSERTSTSVEQQSPAASQGFTLSSLSTQAKMKSLFAWLLKKKRELSLAGASLWCPTGTTLKSLWNRVYLSLAYWLNYCVNCECTECDMEPF